MRVLSVNELDLVITELIKRIKAEYATANPLPYIYFVPNAAYKIGELLAKKKFPFIATFTIGMADFIIDDIIDSGRTYESLKDVTESMTTPPKFLALISKNRAYDSMAIMTEPANEWVQVFHDEQKGIQENIVRIIQY